MDRFDPHGDDGGHGTTGRDFCLIAFAVAIFVVVGATLERWPA